MSDDSCGSSGAHRRVAWFGAGCTLEQSAALQRGEAVASAPSSWSAGRSLICGRRATAAEDRLAAVEAEMAVDRMAAGMDGAT